MKFLPHNLKQIKYKILWLYSKKNIFSIFLDECSRSGSFKLWYKKSPYKRLPLPAVAYPARAFHICHAKATWQPLSLNKREGNFLKVKVKVDFTWCRRGSNGRCVTSIRRHVVVSHITTLVRGRAIGWSLGWPGGCHWREGNKNLI